MLSELIKIGENFNFNFEEENSILDLKSLKKKYDETDDIVKEIYELSQTEGLRYDQTVPFMLRQNIQSTKPHKRMSIGTVFRNGPVTAYRKKDFLQLDFDIAYKRKFKNTYISQIALLLKEIMSLSEKKIIIKVNDQNLLDFACTTLNIVEREKYCRALDKLSKRSMEDVIEKDNLNKELFQDFINFMEKSKMSEDIKLFIEHFECNNVEFSSKLSRGLNFYSGLFFEAYFENEMSSLLGGGMYNVNKTFDKDIHCIGFAIGLERFTKQFKKQKTLSILIDSLSYSPKEIMTQITNLNNILEIKDRPLEIHYEPFKNSRKISKPLIIFSNKIEFINIKNIKKLNDNIFILN